MVDPLRMAPTLLNEIELTVKLRQKDDLKPSCLASDLK